LLEWARADRQLKDLGPLLNRFTEQTRLVYRLVW
jgi:hypothetical protein